MQCSAFHIILDEDLPWVMEITEIRDDFKEVIRELRASLSNPLREELKKRVRAEDADLQSALEELIFKKRSPRKSLAYRMLDGEINPPDWSSLFRPR